MLVALVEVGTLAFQDIENCVDVRVVVAYLVAYSKEVEMP